MAVIFFGCIVLFGLVAFIILRIIQLITVVSLAIFAIGLVVTGGISIVVGLVTSSLLYQWLGGNGYEGLIIAISLLAGLFTATMLAKEIFKEIVVIASKFKNIQF